MPATLVTIPFSHYCDKARWALDRAGVRYEERAYLPGFHQLGTRPRGGRSTPLLSTPHGVLRQSTDIVRFADRRADAANKLYPDDDDARAEVDAFIADLDERFGPETRLVAYHHLLPRPADLVRMVRPGLSARQRLVFRAAIPLLEGPMRRFMRIDERNAERAIERIFTVLDEVSLRLRDGRRYLFGDRFGAADITFAALAAPAVAPPGHGFMTSDISALPAVLRDLIERARATDAGRFVARMYAEERAPDDGRGVVRRAAQT